MNADSAYRQDGNQGASPARLVGLLYEQLIKDVRAALVAIEKGEIVRRTNEIDHALVVLCHLQGTLDLEKGGEVARNLDRFYNVLRGKLLEAQVQGSRDILEKQIANLLILRDAWSEVERVATAPPSSERASFVTATTAESATSDSAPHMDWKA